MTQEDKDKKVSTEQNATQAEHAGSTSAPTEPMVQSATEHVTEPAAEDVAESPSETSSAPNAATEHATEHGTEPSAAPISAPDEKDCTSADAPSKKADFIGQMGTAPINFAPQEQEGSTIQHSAEQASEPHAGENPAPSRFSTMPKAAGHTIPTQEEEENTAESPSAAATPAPELTMGFAAKSFAHMSSLAPLYLFILFTLHIVTSVWLPSVYFPVEMAHLEIYSKMQQAGQWLIPPTSEALGVTLPGYYWFMALVDMLPIPKTIYLPVLSALTACIALTGAYTLALCTKLGKSGSFASGLVLLSCPIFLVFMHMVGPEMLTAGFFSLALALLFRGWTRETAPFSFIFGFLFLALATFTGGFLPLWTTLIASILLILWRGTFSRAHQLDAVIGFGVLILSFALWLIVSILGSDHATALDAIMLTGIAPFLPPYWPLPTPWALVFLAFGLLPWIIAPLFASWLHILGNAFSYLKASRKEDSGPTWLYMVAVVGMVLIVLQKSDALFMAIPLLPVFCLILAKTVCNLSRLGSNVYFLLLAICLLLCGIITTIISIPSTASFWTPYLTEDLTRMVQNLKFLPIISALFILTALLLVRFTKRAFSEGALMVMALFSMLMVQPMTAFIAPSLVGHGAIQHPHGAGLGTLPPSIAPHMPTHPVGDFPVAPLEGEENTQNPAPTPVITAPEPSAPASSETESSTPVLPTDSVLVAPLEGEENTQNPAPTPVITAPEPTTPADNENSENSESSEKPEVTCSAPAIPEKTQGSAASDEAETLPDATEPDTNDL